MEKTIFISLPIEDLQAVIIDCVNSCLKQNRQNNSNHPDSDQLLTVKETGEFLHLSVPTIYGLVSQKGIPVSKKGKRLYFSKQELTEWVKTGRKKTLSEIEEEVSTYVKKRGK